MGQRRSSAPPAALMPLADVIAAGAEDQEPAPPFVAILHGENVEVTAVLQRTAVVASLRDRWADKQVVPLGDLLVDPAAINWRPTVPGAGFPMKRRRYTADQREAMRAASDLRARADQARRAAGEAAARETAALQHTASTTRPAAGATTSRPLAATTSSRPITVSTISTSAPSARQAERGLAAELRWARQRIAELEAELESHQAAAREMLRRIEAVVRRKAA